MISAYIKRYIYRLYHSLLWYIQYYHCKIKRLYNKNVTALESEAFEKPLILVPHSDDEWIGPYSILKNTASDASCLYFNLFGDDYSEKNKETRNREINKSSQYWKFELINNYNFDKSLLVEHLKNHIYIFIPSPYDWHPEHRKVFQTFYEAMCLLSEEEILRKKIFYYSVSVPHIIDEPVHYVRMSRREVAEKWNDFQKIYNSQSFMPALRYKLNLRLVPRECGYAAQFFLSVNKERLTEDYKLSNSENFVNTANYTLYIINNIYKIRTFDFFN